jgi:hypothetical protein
MSSLRADFDELMRRVDRGREFADASYEPIFYLVFHPRDILEIKRLMLGWTARLRNDGWEVEIFSIAQQVGEILAAAPVRKIWIAADRKSSLELGLDRVDPQIRVECLQVRTDQARVRSRNISASPSTSVCRSMATPSCGICRIGSTNPPRRPCCLQWRHVSPRPSSCSISPASRLRGRRSPRCRPSSTTRFSSMPATAAT